MSRAAADVIYAGLAAIVTMANIRLQFNMFGLYTLSDCPCRITEVVSFELHQRIDVTLKMK